MKLEFSFVFELFENLPAILDNTGFWLLAFCIGFWLAQAITKRVYTDFESYVDKHFDIKKKEDVEK